MSFITIRLPWVSRRRLKAAERRARVSEDHARRLDLRFAEASTLATSLACQLEMAHNRNERLVQRLIEHAEKELAL